MALTDNLVGFWKMDEASGTRVDETANNNDLTANGTGGVASAAGKISDAADFEKGDSDYLSIADASQTGLDITGDFTIAFWMKLESLPSSSGSASTIIQKYTAGNGYFVFLADTDDKVYIDLYGGGNTRDISTNAFVVSGDVGNWVHVVVASSLTSGNVAMYKNGSSVSVTTGGTRIGAIGTNAEPFQIGGGSFYNYYDGLLDEFGIWNRLLTGAEVTSLYNSGNGLTYPFASGPAGPRKLSLLGVG
jgi:hypothetical protein